MGVGAAAVEPAAATVGYPTDLLHFQMQHVAAVAGDDRSRLAKRFTVGIELAAPVQPQPRIELGRTAVGALE